MIRNKNTIVKAGIIEDRGMLSFAKTSVDCHIIAWILRSWPIINKIISLGAWRIEQVPATLRPQSTASYAKWLTSSTPFRPWNNIGNFWAGSRKPHFYPNPVSRQWPARRNWSTTSMRPLLRSWRCSKTRFSQSRKRRWSLRRSISEGGIARIISDKLYTICFFVVLRVPGNRKTKVELAYE